jgi:hypothetical protein
MGAVVDTDADDALRVRHHRQEPDIGQLVIGRLTGGHAADVIERIRRERLAQGRKSSAQAARRIDDAIARYHAERGLGADHVTCKLHVPSINLVPIDKARKRDTASSESVRLCGYFTSPRDRLLICPAHQNWSLR